MKDEECSSGGSSVASRTCYSDAGSIDGQNRVIGTSSLPCHPAQNLSRVTHILTSSSSFR